MLAVFGAPDPLDDHAVVAATAALRARDLIETLGRTRRRADRESLQVGFSINTGEVVAGCFGPPERVEYAVLGHAVNLAARLVASARPGQILVGSGSAALLCSRFALRDDGVAQLKSIGLTQKIELIGLRPVADAAGVSALPTWPQKRQAEGQLSFQIMRRTSKPTGAA